MKPPHKRYPRRTAKELMDELWKKPEYVAIMQEKARKRQEAHEAYQEAAKSVLADLAAAGYKVSSVGELVHLFGRTHVPYGSAIPILMKWLPRVTYVPLKEDIVRTLSVPWARTVAARLMIEEFVKVEGDSGPPSGLRWAIGNALWVVADDLVFDDLVAIATEKKYGTDRDMVVMALGNMKNPNASEVLIGLLDDEVVAGHAVTALGKLRAKEARPHLERFLNHPKTWIRNAAKKAIKRIDKVAVTPRSRRNRP